jgi:hypothetical protein
VRAIIRNGRLDYQVLNFGESKPGAAQSGMTHAPDQKDLRLSVVKLY